MAFNNYLSNVNPQYAASQPQNQQQLMAAYAYQQQLMMQQQQQVDQNYQQLPQNSMKMQYQQVGIPQGQQIPIYSNLAQSSQLTPEQLQLQQQMQYQHQMGNYVAQGQSSKKNEISASGGYDGNIAGYDVNENFGDDNDGDDDGNDGDYGDGDESGEKGGYDWENLDDGDEGEGESGVLGKRARPDADDFDDDFGGDIDQTSKVG